jgi:hypothetical protein
VFCGIMSVLENFDFGFWSISGFRLGMLCKYLPQICNKDIRECVKVAFTRMGSLLSSTLATSRTNTTKQSAAHSDCMCSQTTCFQALGCHITVMCLIILLSSLSSRQPSRDSDKVCFCSLQNLPCLLQRLPRRTSILLNK